MIGAVAAALGYVIRLLIETWRDVRKEHNARRARLVELQSLLHAVHVSFRIQIGHNQRLREMIAMNHPEVDCYGGYEQSFANAYNVFTPGEKELHEIIRSITIYSLRPTNQAMMDWLKSDTFFKAQKPSRGLFQKQAKNSTNGSSNQEETNQVEMNQEDMNEEEMNEKVMNEKEMKPSDTNSTPRIVKWTQNLLSELEGNSSRAVLGELAVQLKALEAHLLLWNAKYEVWMNNTPEHALVYLADEKKHGFGFPNKIDAAVSRALDRGI